MGETIDLKSSWLHIFVTKTNDKKNHFKVSAILNNEGTYLPPEFDWRRPMLPHVNFIQGISFQCKYTYVYGNNKNTTR
ncbi:hypothetical protein [Microbulbifer variabilis]|uniref:hypothetical protein n=1 Tax=Microbulbifer variabilis TaxID=266805 RepID=UPI001CFCEFD4|nr:hypothetical protein [Microbulbifer variabilis]